MFENYDKLRITFYFDIESYENILKIQQRFMKMNLNQIKKCSLKTNNVKF